MASPESQQHPTYASLHSGTPVGRTDKVHGLDCYIADAPDRNPRGIVVIVPASFGWKHQNHRVMADRYAKRGNFQVFLPDFMNGVVVPEDVQDSFKAMKKISFWAKPLTKLRHFFYVLYCMLPFVWHCRPAVARPRISNFLKALKTKEAAKLPIGAAGFAWGGYLVIRACWDEATNRTTTGERALECGFVAHPSNSKYPDDIDKIRLPISWAAAEHCRHMSPEQAKTTERILAAKTAKGNNEDGISHEFVMYKGVNYGFAQSSDKKKFAEAEAGKAAETQAVEWFSRQFTKHAIRDGVAERKEQSE